MVAIGPRGFNWLLTGRNIYFVSVPYFRTGGNVISTRFSIVNQAQKSIIQLPSLGERQYNNGYWWDRTDQCTYGKLKE